MEAAALFDVRWEGTHGIGRFARELASRIDVVPYAPARNPLGALEPWRLGCDLRRRSPGFFLSPGFAAVLGYRGPFAITVHDLIHLETEERSLAKVAYYQALLRPTLHRARAILTVSEFSRQRIASWSGLSLERIHVVGNGVSAVFHEQGEILRRDRPFVLYVGNLKPHKNVDVLFRAFSDAGLSRRFDLLLTGAPDPGRTSGPTWVHWLGAVSEESLAAHYRGAHAVVLPSRYEGFGLPVVEAMACAAPVVASDVPALREVSGGAALHFRPDDVAGLARAIEALDAPEVRRRQVDLGRINRQRFDWEAVARRTCSALGLGMIEGA